MCLKDPIFLLKTPITQTTPQLFHPQRIQKKKQSYLWHYRVSRLISTPGSLLWYKQSQRRRRGISLTLLMTTLSGIHMWKPSMTNRSLLRKYWILTKGNLVLLALVVSWKVYKSGDIAPRDLSPYTLNISLYVDATTIYYQNSQFQHSFRDSSNIIRGQLLDLLTSSVQVATNITKSSTKSIVQSLVRKWGMEIEATKRVVKSTTRRIQGQLLTPDCHKDSGQMIVN